VAVSGAISRGQLHVRVEDDGIGISENGVEAHLGIAGMRERIERVGGQFDVRRGKRRGTVVSVTVPVTRGTRVQGLREVVGHDSVDHR
jgi:signal transduction histidine kinase